MTDKFSLKSFLREHKRDLMLILSLLFISGILALILSLTAKGGDAVRVEIDGELFATYSLSESGEYELGEGNLLVIEGGEAYMKRADCPDGTCVRTGRISRRGQSIICLPNRVSVTVIRDAGGADLVS